MQTNRFPLSLLLILFISTIFSSCQIEKFDELKPYAIQVGKYRAETDAANTFERLKNMGTDPYLLKHSTSTEGAWFAVVIGAYNTLEETMADKIKFEDNYGFLNIEIINYNSVKKDISHLKFSELDIKKLETISKNESNITKTASELHFSGVFQLMNALVIRTLDSVNILRISSMKNSIPDFPRGIVPQNIINNSECVVEGIYQDQLIGGDFTTQVIKLKENNPYGDDAAEYFAKKIIDTREYDFEEMIPIEVHANKSLKGYLVNIEPRKGRLMRYMVLADNAQAYLYFVQSAKCTKDQIVSFSNNLGKNNGALSYYHFQNSFQTLPASDSLNDLISFSTIFNKEKTEGNLAKLRDGNIFSKSVFRNKMGKGAWEYFLQQYNSDSLAQKVFSMGYSPRRNLSKDSLMINGYHGWHTTLRRRIPGFKKLQNITNEVQLLAGHNIFILSNKGRGRLPKDEMIDFAKQLQLIAQPHKE